MPTSKRDINELHRLMISEAKELQVMIDRGELVARPGSHHEALRGRQYEVTTNLCAHVLELDEMLRRGGEAPAAWSGSNRTFSPMESPTDAAKGRTR